MRWPWLKPPAPALPQPKEGYRYTHIGHDESKGVEAYYRDRKAALEIQLRFGERGQRLRRVK